jgi:hypothetical protein
MSLSLIRPGAEVDIGEVLSLTSFAGAGSVVAKEGLPKTIVSS